MRKTNSFKLVKIAVIALILSLVPMKAVFAAGSLTVSVASLSLTPGTTGSFDVIADGASGTVAVASSNNTVAVVTTPALTLENEAKAVEIKALSPGVASVTVVLSDVSTEDGRKLTGARTVAVTVVGTQAAPSTEETPKAEDSINNNNNNNNNSAEPEAPAENTPLLENVSFAPEPEVVPLEDLPAVPVTNDEEESAAAQDIVISKFVIEGHNINFDPNVLKYTINIAEGEEKLNIVVEGEELGVTGDGEVNIAGQSSIVVKVQRGDKEKEYLITLKRSGAAEENSSESSDTSEIVATMGSLAAGSSSGKSPSASDGVSFTSEAGGEEFNWMFIIIPLAVVGIGLLAALIALLVLKKRGNKDDEVISLIQSNAKQFNATTPETPATPVTPAIPAPQAAPAKEPTVLAKNVTPVATPSAAKVEAPKAPVERPPVVAPMPKTTFATTRAAAPAAAATPQNSGLFVGASRTSGFQFGKFR